MGLAGAGPDRARDGGDRRPAEPGNHNIQAVADLLDNDPTRKLHGKEKFRDWMQQLSDTAVNELAGTHFDIPAEIRELECMIAPTSDGSIYYTGPSEDLTSRPAGCGGRAGRRGGLLPLA